MQKVSVVIHLSPSRIHADGGQRQRVDGLNQGNSI
jgi:hypothetical protein